ncbi:MAG: hypothetical protein NT027_01845 [Proteobacteria bacterium]|nr:hypothetical protein [Pseudomonadota bacterium]
MKRLWRSVFILALCLGAVVYMRVYLKDQMDIASVQSENDESEASVYSP